MRRFIQANNTATAFGELDSRLGFRLNVKEVLWPASCSNISEIVLPAAILWEGTNISGVFFLNRSTLKEAQWSWLASEVVGDWMEPVTNLFEVQFSIRAQKGGAAGRGLLEIPGVPYPRRFSDNPVLRSIYLNAFRDAYHEALLNHSGFPHAAGVAPGQVRSPAILGDYQRQLSHGDMTAIYNSGRLPWGQRYCQVLASMARNPKRSPTERVLGSAFLIKSPPVFPVTEPEIPCSPA